MSINPFENHFIDREAWSHQTGENSARGAWAWGTVTSKGWGEFAIKKVIDFGLTFVTDPIVSYGWVLGDDDKLVDGRFPRVDGGVTRWRKDKRGFYTGAYVMITVATVDPMIMPTTDVSSDPGYSIEHHFTFYGTALKDINADMFKD